MGMGKMLDNILWESNEQRLLGVNIDKNLRFENHVENICNKADIKLTAIARYSRFLNFDKTKSLVKAIIDNQFAYCPLVWMFHSRNIN